MSTIDDEHMIGEIVAEQQRAWNAGDATSYAARFHADGTFTNVFGDRYFGRDAFRERHATIFSTFAKGSKASLVVHRIHFPVPGTAVVDIDCVVESRATLPPGLSSIDQEFLASGVGEGRRSVVDCWLPQRRPQSDARPCVVVQLGLKVEQTKGSWEHLVIDHVERPSPN